MILMMSIWLVGRLGGTPKVLVLYGLGQGSFFKLCRPAGRAGTFSPGRAGENSMKDILRCGNWRRGARRLSTIWKARGLLLGDCEAILRKDTWAAPVKLRKLRRGELRMVPRGEGGGWNAKAMQCVHAFPHRKYPRILKWP